jgi:hypothetical protein
VRRDVNKEPRHRGQQKGTDRSFEEKSALQGQHRSRNTDTRKTETRSTKSWSCSGISQEGYRSQLSEEKRALQVGQQKSRHRHSGRVQAGTSVTSKARPASFVIAILAIWINTVTQHRRRSREVRGSWYVHSGSMQIDRRA